jgi:thiol-disulfide isomerase/thioredoxin
MNNKKMIIMIIVVALVAAGGAYMYSNQNSDLAMDKDEITEDMNGMAGNEMDKMEEDKGMDSDMDKDDDNMDISMDDKMMNEGEMAPEFTLTAVDGMDYVLSDYMGDKVYLKFWASWCPICLSELEALDELSTTDEFKVLTIVSPGVGSEKDRDDFIEWYSGLDTENIIVLLDDGGEIAAKYMVRGYPTSAYVGSDGVLVDNLPGPKSNETIKDKFQGIY